MTSKKLSAEDYLQGFHNAHHYVEDHSRNGQEWYDLLEAGHSMHGIAAPKNIHRAHRARAHRATGGSVDDALSLTAQYQPPLPGRQQSKPGRR